MRLIHLVPLIPLALAAPAKVSIPELSPSEWGLTLSGFVDDFRSLSSWSWNKAEQVVEEMSVAPDMAPDSSMTIYQQLRADPNSFSKLVKVLEFEKVAAKYLDDADLQITFFAPNNDALTPPHRRKHDDGDDDDDDVLAELLENPSLSVIAAALEDEPSLTIADHDDDDERRRHRRAMFRKIAGKVLKYHGLGEAYTAQDIAQNSTLATVLQAEDGSYGGLFRRLRVEKSLVPPSVKLNFYAKILVADIKATNGYLHTLNHPLIPPGSIFQSAYLLPDIFSTFTSAVQREGGRKYIDWVYDPEESTPGHREYFGTPLATAFAPDNVAFLRLPPRLKLFLFSPFGHRALRAILAYHYVPRTLLLSELLYTEKEVDVWGGSDAVESVEYFNDPSFHKELEIHPLLPNSTLNVVIDKSKYLPVEGAIKTTIRVNGQEVRTIDVPARNGAFHVIDKLLVPPHRHHDHHGEDISSMDSWENWEEWLHELAEEF